MDEKHLFTFYNQQIFENGKMMLTPGIDSIDFHAMTHEDTEILGMFCDFTGLHGDGIKRILIEGLLYEHEQTLLRLKQ
jgi:hypothetical protein